MKHLFLYGSVVILFFSCSQDDHTNDSEKKYGAPKAVITDQPNKEDKIKGPLAYAPDIPRTPEGDTVDVKFDVTHQLFQVSKTVSFTAWMFGGSVPGPVLKIRQGQTIRFSMTDRSNDTMKGMTMQVNMMPMPHSIDFHAAMVNPEDKYRTINPGETKSVTFPTKGDYPITCTVHQNMDMVVHVS